MPRRTYCLTDVLLVHPAVEDANPHEAAIGVGPRRREAFLGPSVVVDLAQRSEALLADVAEVRKDLGGRPVGQGDDPCLVERSDVVAHVRQRAHVDIGRRRVDARQHRLGSDDVCDVGLYVPPGTGTRQPPFVVGEISEQLVQRPELIRHALDHRVLRKMSGHGVSFWIVIQSLARK